MGTNQYCRIYFMGSGIRHHTIAEKKRHRLKTNILFDGNQRHPHQ
jgi:hypothetical protein